MIAEVISNSGTLEFRSLAGASAAGLPVGSILALHTTRVPAGYLPCNGATYDITQYPALYTILQTNVLPDLREANLVGAGANSTHSISTHDTYTVGQFKDDQVQEVITGAESETYITDPGHCHNYPQHQCCNACGASTDILAFDSVSSKLCSYTCSSTTGITAQTTTTLTTDANARTGSVTHGKNYGVFFVIKAVTGITELDDAEVYAQVVELLENNYIAKSELTDNAIPFYDATNECFSPITAPTADGQVLTWDEDNQEYAWQTNSGLAFYGTEAEYEQETIVGNSLVSLTDKDALLKSVNCQAPSHTGVVCCDLVCDVTNTGLYTLTCNDGTSIVTLSAFTEPSGCPSITALIGHIRLPSHCNVSHSIVNCDNKLYAQEEQSGDYFLFPITCVDTTDNYKATVDWTNYCYSAQSEFTDSEYRLGNITYYEEV